MSGTRSLQNRRAGQKSTLSGEEGGDKVQNPELEPCSHERRVSVHYDALHEYSQRRKGPWRCRQGCESSNRVKGKVFRLASGLACLWQQRTASTVVLPGSRAAEEWKAKARLVFRPAIAKWKLMAVMQCKADRSRRVGGCKRMNTRWDEDRARRWSIWRKGNLARAVGLSE
ncbi:hypothetical protein BCV70DRAFT_101873 [Testicularia cyperi]|uniref:Uncharacterized protein n=1 Tax=Testicularia cyperi TaxID=1882483 RepID=A0A317XG89_9BASI|nr:hypothetical protein BCV70DRAFT_101873 [Testicularia cyperi]